MKSINWLLLIINIINKIIVKFFTVWSVYEYCRYKVVWKLMINFIIYLILKPTIIS